MAKDIRYMPETTYHYKGKRITRKAYTRDYTKPDHDKPKVAGFIQLEEQAIDMTPIYYIAITTTIRKNTILRWDKAEKTLTIVPKDL